MEKHRIRTAQSIDGNPKPHMLVELQEDRWLEVTEKPIHEQIHRALAEETREFHVAFTERAFHVGIIRNWQEAGTIS